MDESDEIIATVECSKDAYITVFVVVKDSIQIIYPNIYMRNNFLIANKKIQIPSDDMHKQGYRLRVYLPQNKNKSFELIGVVATKEKIDFRSKKGKNSLSIYDASLMDFNNWLVDIPLDKRAISYSAHEIRR